MGIQKTIEDLKNRPQHERAAVARTVAISVGVVLFIGWAYFFLTNIKSTVPVAAIDNANTQAAQAISATQAEVSQQYASTTDALFKLSVAAEIEAQREQDAAQSATGTATTTDSGTSSVPVYTQ